MEWGVGVACKQQCGSWDKPSGVSSLGFEGSDFYSDNLDI